MVPPVSLVLAVRVVVVPTWEVPGVMRAWTLIQLPSSPATTAVRVTTPEPPELATMGHRDCSLMLVMMLVAMVAAESPDVIGVSTNWSTHQNRWLPFDVAAVAIVMVAAAAAPALAVTAIP